MKIILNKSRNSGGWIGLLLIILLVLIGLFAVFFTFFRRPKMLHNGDAEAVPIEEAGARVEPEHVFRGEFTPAPWNE